MIILKRDVTDPQAPTLLLFKDWVPNADGTMSLLMPDGLFAYQVPNQYGVFTFTPVQDGAYQRAKLNGQLVSFWTRPQDAPYVYSWAELPN
jgi:hypothetical protein